LWWFSMRALNRPPTAFINRRWILSGPAEGEEEAKRLAEKICRTRVFSDAAGKMNLALADVVVRETRAYMEQMGR